jgi:hypothetical protein
MDNIENRKSNMKWLSEGSNHQVFVKHERLETEIFDNNTAILLFEDYLVDLCKQLEKIDLKAVEKLKQKIKTLEAKITVLEQSNKDDNSSLIN